MYQSPHTMARGRMLNKTVCTDGKVRRLGELYGPNAMLLHHRLIAFLDKNGNVRADPHWLKGTIFPYESDISPETCRRLAGGLTECELAVAYQHDGVVYLNFPDFIKNQVGLRADREQPECPTQSEPIQYLAFVPETLQQPSGNLPASCRKTSGLTRAAARARPRVSPSPSLPSPSDSEKEEERATTDSPQKDLAAENRAPDIPSEIVRIMQRIGESINCDAYRWVTVLKWTAPLKGAALEFGWRCLYLQALRFETWIIGQHQAGKLKHGKHPNPLNRFLNQWVRGKFPDETPHVSPADYTTGDTETSWPDTKPSDQYHNLSV